MALFSTAYFPCIGYMAQAMKADVFHVELFETYHKQTYRNRCKVMTANGVQILSVPVIKTFGNHTMTKDITISYIEHWQQIHRRCLESGYKATPYFDHYFPFISPIFEDHFATLIELNETALKSVFSMLKTEKEIVYTTDYDKNAADDLRNAFSPKAAPEAASFPPYYQTFEERFPFAPNLSILDLIFNEGPGSMDYLMSL